ncbi:MAG TPA: relaxase domain-containing protein [Candidatus Sulfotelmatobacter sp.]|jgi:conjugative relaxase-like TrwC/TraI family protein
MLTISKPLSGSQARTYHEREFASQKQNYWSRDQQGHSEWQGKLAEQWKLSGSVEAEHFARLSEGQHPHTAAACSPPSFENLRRQIRQRSHQRGTPRRVGRDVLRAQISLAHRSRGRG